MPHRWCLFAWSHQTHYTAPHPPPPPPRKKKSENLTNWGRNRVFLISPPWHYRCLGNASVISITWQTVTGCVVCKEMSSVWRSGDCWQRNIFQGSNRNPSKEMKNSCIHASWNLEFPILQKIQTIGRETTYTCIFSLYLLFICLSTGVSVRRQYSLC